MDLRVNMEETKNQRQMHSMLDKPSLVMYGMGVQLRHVPTGLYLNGESFTALEEKDCLRLSLSPGDLNCSFKIMPRFKVRQEGSEIYYRDQLLLYNSKMGLYGLHASNKVYDALEPPPAVSEMNLSTEPSSLKVGKFARFTAADREAKLFASLDLVRFFHPETDSFLSCSCSVEKESRKVPYLRKVRACESRSDELRRRYYELGTSIAVFYITNTHPLDESLRSSQNTENLSHDESAKSMWAIELLDYKSSSPIEWRTTDANGTETEEMIPTGLVWLPEEEEGAVEGCDTLLKCFTQTIYLGIRAGDIAEILDDPDESNYTTRMLFDLSFFLILGILFFDMVTGIILDTFGALREEVAERKTILQSESFVSGLERKEIEEIGEGLNFDSSTRPTSRSGRTSTSSYISAPRRRVT